ncbi:mariner Mos1 transposase [Trichonephila clavipes]|nr:mariner Mos1 transposase [Trichonephila clavipes]
MLDPSSFADPTPLAHADTSRDVLPRRDRIVTGDETWVMHVNCETKLQSMQWCHRSSPKRPRKCWDRQGVLLIDFLEPGATINSERYCQTLRNLRRTVQNKRRGKLTSIIFFLHDNARPHTANCTQELLNSFKWEVFPHPPYSPDLAPSDFHLFPKLKQRSSLTTTRSCGCASLSG